MERNGTEISVWNMEDARMEWNGRFQKWNGRQSSILPYQFHTRFRSLYLQKSTYRCRVVINNIVTEVFNFNILAYYLPTNRRTLLVVYIVQCANSVRIASLLVHCNLIAELMLQLTTLIELTCFFVLRLTICPVVNFVSLHRHENSYLLFYRHFSLILFIVLVFKLIAILFGVKAWYFYYGKCFS